MPDEQYNQFAFLRLIDGEGVHHLLPYGHLLHSSMAQESVIELLFAAHSATITGERLGTLLDRIQEMTKKQISITPKESIQKDKPVIQGVQVSVRLDDQAG